MNDQVSHTTFSATKILTWLRVLCIREVNEATIFVTERVCIHCEVWSEVEETVDHRAYNTT